MFERPDSGDQALLVHIDTGQWAQSSDRAASAKGSQTVPDQPCVDLARDRSEFSELATSAGLQVVEVVTGRSARPNAKHFIGRGKIEQIQLALREHEIDVVLFGQRLSPSQERNLERELKVRVLDRNSLILDIFAQRARTFEGKLQVELAQLVHLSTRLVRGWTHLERQKGGIGLRGPGETQLETDRRLLNERVRVLKKRLGKVRKQREQGRSKRTKSNIATVALVGYTNAGKSTLFNQMTQQSVYAADQLFATLDPTMRRLELQRGISAVLVDTVGFIRDLPHELVDAFRSTLTETLEADLLLHIIDDSDVERESHRAAVEHVLHGIGAEKVPQMMVYNKIDLSGHDARVDRSESGDPESAWVCARTGVGVDALMEAIAERLSRDRVTGWMTLKTSQGKLRAQLYAASAVVQEVTDDDGVVQVLIDIDSVDYARLIHEHGLSYDAVVPEEAQVAARLRA
ncbi:MAG: GTPase HflX [Granulosicoccus sp.]|nr:GTPase HflX [Granulosicoccus sp.]